MVQQEAYVLPGQGSQKVGMGAKLNETSPAAKEVFEEANEVLHRDLAKLMFEGPAEELGNTANSQPAIVTASIACWRALQESQGYAGEGPELLAGHSLGQYSSLAVSGALPFSRVLQLVCTRGELMQKASIARPGSMAAIMDLSELAIEEVCRETGTELAIDNSDNQVVISGDVMAVDLAVVLVTQKGGKASKLSVSGAFHSSLMLDAERGLIEAIGGANIQDAQIPIVANCTAEPILKAQDLQDELVKGLSKRVMWRGSVLYMLQAGIRRFVELGPGGVLSRLIRQIEKNAEVVSISDPASILKLAETKK